MRLVRPALAAFLVLGIISPAFAQEATSPPATAPKPAPPPAIYDEKADARAQIDAALAEARKNHRRVLVQWGANWCGWCHRLHALFTKEASVRKTLLYEYDVVLIDIGRFDKHMDLAGGYGADLSKNGVPFLTILDAEGKVVANQETGSLEENSGEFHHSPARVNEFLAKHQAAYPNAEEQLSAAVAEAKEEDRLVFVHFGAPWCGWCHRLEDWMAREDVKAILDKEFIDLAIDIERSEGSTGKGVYDRIRNGPEGGIPWFAFLDAEGQTLATSTGPKGNVGFPYEDFEIAHFVDMLKKSARHLSSGDVETLAASLGESKKKDKEAR